MTTTIPATEHAQKYEALAQRIGVAALRQILPATPARLQAALAAGDKHLNTIPLPMWDRAAGAVSYSFPADFHDGPRLSFKPPWTPRVANGLSLAERVCVLKHVASYHLEPGP